MMLLNGRAPNLNRALRLLIIGIGITAWFTSTFTLKQKSVGPAASGPLVMAGYALALIGCVCLLYGSLGYAVPGKLSYLVYLGKISFGLYVFHILGLKVAEQIRPWFFRAPVLWIALHGILGFVFTLALAALSYRYVETPFLKMKSRFEWIASRPITS